MESEANYYSILTHVSAQLYTLPMWLYLHSLYPTIATKIVNGAKNKTYASKKDVYAVLTSDAEKSKLNEYDASIKISAPDKALQQFKASQICKYECGSRVSNSYRDEQIKQVQADRSVSSGADSSDRAKLGELLNIAID